MRIIFTRSAQKQVKAIHNYFSIAASKKVADSIKQQIFDSTRILINNPNAGQIEDYLAELGMGHRRIVEGNYKIIYRIHGDTIYVTDVFDSRQNPIKMKRTKP